MMYILFDENMIVLMKCKCWAILYKLLQNRVVTPHKVKLLYTLQAVSALGNAFNKNDHLHVILG